MLEHPIDFAWLRRRFWSHVARGEAAELDEPFIECCVRRCKVLDFAAAKPAEDLADLAGKLLLIGDELDLKDPEWDTDTSLPEWHLLRSAIIDAERLAGEMAPAG